MFNHLPDKITLISGNAHKLLETLFHYRVTIIDPNKFPNNNKYVELIYSKLVCPECFKQLHFNDLWSNKKEKKVAMIRTCHNCCMLFLLSGRFNNYDKYLRTYKFYDNKVYSKITNKKKKEANENTCNQGGKKTDNCKS